MPQFEQISGGRRGIRAAAAVGVTAMAGAALIAVGVTASGDEPPRAPAAVSSASARASSGASATPSAAAPAATPPNAAGASAPAADFGPVMPRSAPVSLAIPSIGLRTADFTDLGLERDGSLEVPTDFDDVGWLSSSFAPGQTGPAILAGHVDSRKGPAVFYRLGEMKPGQQISVTRQDRSVAVFTVDRIQRFPKDRFPTAAVYGNTQRAELRLITCGGVFDRKTRHYKDNVVVFANLTATR